MTKLVNRFINFKTKSAYDTFMSDKDNSISDESIVFITDTDSRDILTHGKSIVQALPRLSSYSSDSGTKYGTNKGAANLNFISGDSITVSADENGVTISSSLPIQTGIATGSLTANSDNTAKGLYSIAEGVGTITTNEAEHACGKYNESHANDDKFSSDHEDGAIGTAHTVYSIGGGKSDTERNNLFEVMDNGDIYIFFKGEYRRLQTLLDDSFTVSDNTFTIISDSK